MYLANFRSMQPRTKRHVTKLEIAGYAHHVAMMMDVTLTLPWQPLLPCCCPFSLLPSHQPCHIFVWNISEAAIPHWVNQGVTGLVILTAQTGILAKYSCYTCGLYEERIWHASCVPDWTDCLPPICEEYYISLNSWKVSHWWCKESFYRGTLLPPVSAVIHCDRFLIDCSAFNPIILAKGSGKNPVL